VISPRGMAKGHSNLTWWRSLGQGNGTLVRVARFQVQAFFGNRWSFEHRKTVRKTRGTTADGFS
jgi:hypothetical protein